MAMISENCTVKGRAVQAQLVESPEKGTPGIQIQFIVTEEGKWKNSNVRFDGWFTENTSERVIESLGYCGWEGDDIGEFGDRQLHGLDKNEVHLVVEVEPYQGDDPKYEGKSFPRVAWINRLGGRGLNVENAMSPAKAASFGERMRGLVLKTREKNGKAKESNGEADTDFNYGANVPESKPAAPEQRKF